MSRLPAGPEKAVLYTRVSDAKQLEKFGLAGQETTCRAYCERFGMEVVDVFEDRAISGEIRDRPAVIALTRFLKPKGIKHVVIDNVNRFVRRLRFLDDLIDAIYDEDSAVEIHFVSNGLIQKYGEPRLYVHFLGAMSEEDKRQLLARLARGRYEAVKSGKWVGGTLPDGYKLEYHKETGETEILIDKDRALVIREMIRKYLEPDVSFEGTARHLNSLEFRTPRGSIWGSGDVNSRLQVIDAYAGHLYQGKMYVDRKTKKQIAKPREEWVPVKVPPIIDEDTAHRVKAKIQARSRKRGRYGSGRYLFSGLLICGKCNRKAPVLALTGKNWRNKAGLIVNRKSEQYGYYGCLRKQKGHTYKDERISCEGIGSLRTSIYDGVFYEAVTAKIAAGVLNFDFQLDAPIWPNSGSGEEFADNSEVAKERTARQAETPMSELDPNIKIEKLKSDLAEHKRRKSRLTDAFIDGNLDSDDYNRRAKEEDAHLDYLKGELKRIESSIALAVSQEQRLRELQANTLTWLKRFRSAQTFDERRALLLELGVRIIVNGFEPMSDDAKQQVLRYEVKLTVPTG